MCDGKLVDQTMKTHEIFRRGGRSIQVLEQSSQLRKKCARLIFVVELVIGFNQFLAQQERLFLPLHGHRDVDRIVGILL